MKTLILMRHAKSDWSKPGQRDKERTLNNRGRRAAPVMADWLRALGHGPEAALVSDAVRTRETWALMGFAVEAQFDAGLYLAEAHVYLTAIQAAPDCACLLVLGHNPGMEIAMGLMTDGGRMSAPTAATGVYTLPIRAWADARFGIGTKIAFETPKSLKRSEFEDD